MTKTMIFLVFMISIFLFVSSEKLSAQNNDSIKSATTADTTNKANIINNAPTTTTPANSNPDSPTNVNPEDMKDMGVAVSPASMHLFIKPGTTVVKELKVANDTKDVVKFKIGFNDFQMTEKGKPQAMNPENSKYALSKWIAPSPTYFELQPHAVQKVKLTISIPDEEDAYVAAWTIVTVDQVRDRKPLDIKGNEQTLGFGVYTSIGFGVYVYQNPPNVKNQNVEIQKFAISTDSLGKRSINMHIKNTGDGIGFSSSYVELTNLNTGKQTRLGERKFTVLPQFERDFVYLLPDDLAKGKYSAIGIIDFGSKELIQAAEIEFTNP